jgi:class 3 adenylate cyclase
MTMQRTATLHGAHKEMILQTIPDATTAIKEKLNADQGAPSEQIDDIISRYLHVRDSASSEQIGNELTAVFADGLDRAARIVANLEASRRMLDETRSLQQQAHVFIDLRSRLHPAFRENRLPRFSSKAGVPLTPQKTPRLQHLQAL